MKTLFATDLDNTLIYSRQKRYADDICVEIYEDKEYSFMPKRVYDEINKLSAYIDILPITTRSVEQYNRLMLPDCIKKAAVANGTIIIANSQTTIAPSVKNLIDKTLPQIKSILEKHNYTQNVISCRLVDDMYLCFICNDIKTAEKLCKKHSAEHNDLLTMRSGRKVYICPPWATKARVLDLKNQYDHIIAAGDSSLDIPMLMHADFAIVPSAEMAHNLNNAIKNNKPDKIPAIYTQTQNTKTFPEFVVDTINNII